MATQKSKADKAAAKARRNAARKEARAAKKAANKRTPEHKGARPDSGTAEKAGVGNKAHPGNQRVPEDAVIRRAPVNEQGTKITDSPEVQGDKGLMIIDDRQSRPVHVSLIEGKGLHKDVDGRVLLIQGAVSTNIVPVANAKSLFAIKKDGTLIYNDRGFDDVPANAEFDMLDIVKLIEHNNG
jgi:hypothetical protein